MAFYEWKCGSCAFINPSDISVCKMCMSPQNNTNNDLGHVKHDKNPSITNNSKQVQNNLMNDIPDYEKKNNA